MENSKPSTTRVVVAIACGVLALVALGIAAFVFNETPEAQRDGRVAILFAIASVMFASAFLVVIAGKPVMQSFTGIIKKLSP